MDQLLEAEITTLGLREPKPLTLQRILGDDVQELAQLLHEEVPVRYAQRIKMLEALPDWESKGSITRVRQMYVTSFKELRLADPRSPPKFQKLLRKIKKRHAQTNLLVGAFKQYAEVEELGEAQSNEWLDRFFALRVSANMLMSHYLQISGSPSSFSSPLLGEFAYGYKSAIDAQCQPSRIARLASGVVARLCRMQYGVAPEIVQIDSEVQALPFVPRYLFYILSELLKNSMRATVEHHTPKHWGEVPSPGDAARNRELQKKLPPITVLVSGDEHVCCVRISDEGGGIPVDRLSHVWSYLYTTAAPIEHTRSQSAVDAPAELMSLTNQADVADSLLMRSPMAGLGCGLPLSRLYGRYLGGSVELQTLPGYGTDVFVYLDRLGDFAEALPHL